jgi:hypothetical protein
MGSAEQHGSRLFFLILSGLIGFRYVEQNDIHTPYISVEESLHFSSALRLPIGSDRKRFVKEVCAGCASFVMQTLLLFYFAFYIILYCDCKDRRSKKNLHSLRLVLTKRPRLELRSFALMTPLRHSVPNGYLPCSVGDGCNRAGRNSIEAGRENWRQWTFGGGSETPHHWC